MITFRAANVFGVPPAQMVALCGGVFIVPFFLFSATAGQVSDKWPMNRVAVGTKIWEVGVALLAAAGFVSNQVGMLVVCLFFMGMQSTFFGPVKYAIIPALVSDEELVSANAWVGMGTFVAILLGTVTGGALVAVKTIGPALVGGAAVFLALCGWFASTRIPGLSPADPELKIAWNPVGPTWRILAISSREKTVLAAILGICWFWMLGIMALSLIPPYGRDFLHGSEAVVTLFLALFSLGVGAGAMVCRRLSGGELKPSLAVFGGLGITLFAGDLYLAGLPASLAAAAGGEYLSLAAFLSAPGAWRIAADLLLFSMSGGLFIIPLYAVVQKRSRAEERSRTIASLNVQNAGFMAAGSVLLAWLLSRGLSIPTILLLFAAANLAALALLCAAWPELTRAMGHVFGRKEKVLD
ncbi:MAG: MFS transporter [Deltaproteobacteria bacterium]|nr:MFS transporter [Deltaproteobacteria bacterium]